MGIYELLTQVGSNSTRWNGATPIKNILATSRSPLHGVGTREGYSINGAFQNLTAQAYAMYDDGVSNPLPKPSVLDWNGRVAVKYSSLPHR